jgi:hypothetical protein
VAHQDYHISRQEFRVPERGVDLPFLKIRERGEEKARSADYTEGHEQSPPDPDAKKNLKYPLSQQELRQESGNLHMEEPA